MISVNIEENVNISLINTDFDTVKFTDINDKAQLIGFSLFMTV